MPSQQILEWLADQGLTTLYTTDEVANPTSGDALLFSYNVATAMLTLRFTFINGSTASTTYAIQKDEGSGWEDMVRPSAHPQLLEPVSVSVPLEPGQSIRVGIVANANATGTSRVVVEYVETGRK
jgi:hypothetical protein